VILSRMYTTNEKKTNQDMHWLWARGFTSGKTRGLALNWMSPSSMATASTLHLLQCKDNRKEPTRAAPVGSTQFDQDGRSGETRAVIYLTNAAPSLQVKSGQSYALFLSIRWGVSTV
jgi:hypothetical protein